MLATLLLHAALGQAPGLEPSAPAPAATTPPAESTAPAAPPAAAPSPDSRDALDAPVTRTVAPDADNVPLRFDQDFPSVAAHALLNAVALSACLAVPAALLTGGVGLLALLPSLGFAVLWPAGALVPLLLLPLMGPACLLWGTAGSVGGTLVAQLTGGRRGPLLPAVGTVLLALLPLGLAWVLPPLVASVSLAVLGGIVAVGPLTAQARGDALTPGEAARAQGFVVLAVAHPVLLAGWALVGVTVAALVAGAAGAVTYWQLGRPLEANEDPEVDLTEVGPRPLLTPTAPVPAQPRGR